MTTPKTLNRDITILIVESSQTQRATLEYLLQTQGYQVIIADNGKDAITLARQHTPHLVISDAVMPEMDGFSLCRSFREEATLSDIPFLLMISLDTIEEIIRGLESGADNFIYKPYNSTSLVDRIDTIFLNRQMRRKVDKQEEIQIIHNGKKYLLNVEPEQILDFLVSFVKDSMDMNKRLKERESELQKVRKAADLASFEKSNFLASLSHEIRTLMTNILGLLELLNMSKLDVDQHSTLMTAYDSAKLLLRIIHDMLDYPKIESKTREAAFDVDSDRELCGFRGPVPVSDPVDRRFLVELVGDDTAAQWEILVDFQHSNAEDSALLVDAVRNNNLTEAMNMAHRIKSACMLVGAETLGMICQQIEAAGEREDEEAVRLFADRFQQEVERLNVWFDTHQDEKDGH